MPEDERRAIIDLLPTHKECRKAWIPKEMIWNWSLFKVTEEQVARLAAHYRKYPFDKIRDGLIWIMPKVGGSVVVFQPNEEQSEILDYVETEHYQQRPVDIVILKARQIGASTLSAVINYCMVSTQPYYKTHVIPHTKKVTFVIKRMIRRMHRHDHPLLRPGILGDNNESMEFESERLGITDSHIQWSSAEQFDNIGVGDNFQMTHMTEKAKWANADELSGYLNPTILRTYPAINICESTGEKTEDAFHAQYYNAKDGNGGAKAFFFGVFAHREYSTPLPEGLSPETFIESLSDDDKERMALYGTTVEQIYWYTEERKRWVGKNIERADWFCREYPCNEEEAFFTSASSFFDVDRLKRDAILIGSLELCAIKDLKPAMLPNDDKSRPRYARATLFIDESNDFKDPELRDDPVGIYEVFERPRPGYEYAILLDPSEGKALVANVKSTLDYTSMGVWRLTYDEKNEPHAAYLVAAVRKQSLGPVEVTKHAFALAKIYGFGDHKKVLFTHEVNNHGHVVTVKGQELGMNFYLRQRGGQIADRQTMDIGWYAGTGHSDDSKYVVVHKFKELYEHGNIRHLYAPLNKEMRTYHQDERKRLRGMGSNHDDTVSMSYLLVPAMKYKFGRIGACSVTDAKWSAPKSLELTEEAPRLSDLAMYRKLFGDSGNKAATKGM